MGVREGSIRWLSEGKRASETVTKSSCTGRNEAHIRLGHCWRLTRASFCQNSVQGFFEGILHPPLLAIPKCEGWNNPQTERSTTTCFISVALVMRMMPNLGSNKFVLCCLEVRANLSSKPYGLNKRPSCHLVRASRFLALRTYSVVGSSTIGSTEHDDKTV